MGAPYMQLYALEVRAVPASPKGKFLGPLKS